MLLSKILENNFHDKEDINISGIAFNNQAVKKGYLFFAIVGNKFNGCDFIDVDHRSSPLWCKRADYRVEAISSIWIAYWINYHRIYSCRDWHIECLDLHVHNGSHITGCYINLLAGNTKKQAKSCIG